MIDIWKSGAEPQGKWGGRGKEQFSLPHLIEEVDFRAMQDSVSNHLVGKRQSKQLTYFELLFGAPKTVSIMWALSEKNRSTIEEIQEGAVRAAMSYLEEDLKKASLFALFEHGSDQYKNPDLHTHVLLFNLHGMNLSELDDLLPTVYALYRADLSAGLIKILGLKIVRDGDSFKVDGVPDHVVAVFSKQQ